MENIKVNFKQILKDNDVNAFNKLVKQYYKEIYAYVFKQVLNKADAYDYTQDIFIKVFTNIKKYNPKKSKFRTFLYRVANHYIIDIYRSKTYQDNNNLISIQHDIPDNHDVLENMIVNEDIIYINRLINKLPTAKQEVIRLRFYAECSLQEISEILNISLSNTKYHYYESLKLLKIWIKEGDMNENTK